MQREANQLHRSLVTNFSFMDFPVQDAAVTPRYLLTAEQAFGPRGSLSGLGALRRERAEVPLPREVGDMWARQVADFERQLQTGAASSGERLTVTEPGSQSEVKAEDLLSNLQLQSVGQSQLSNPVSSLPGISSLLSPAEFDSGAFEAMLQRAVAGAQRDAVNALPETRSVEKRQIEDRHLVDESLPSNLSCAAESESVSRKLSVAQSKPHTAAELSQIPADQRMSRVAKSAVSQSPADRKVSPVTKSAVRNVSPKAKSALSQSPADRNVSPKAKSALSQSPADRNVSPKAKSALSQSPADRNVSPKAKSALSQSPADRNVSPKAKSALSQSPADRNVSPKAKSALSQSPADRNVSPKAKSALSQSPADRNVSPKAKSALSQSPADPKAELKTLSHLEARLKRKAEAARDKFAEDPAKFNLIFNQELVAYVDVCCFAGLENMALSVLRVIRYSRQAGEQSGGPVMKQIQDIRVFNRLMHSYAKKCLGGEVGELFSMLQDEGLTPNMQTYAAVLECMGRRGDLDLDEGQGVLDDMAGKGLDVREIFNQCTFQQDERQVIEKVLTDIQPTFEARAPPLPQFPQGPLVEGLSFPPCPSEVVEKNPYAGILTQRDAHRLQELQMQREISGSVTFKSILKHPPPSQKTRDYRKKLDQVRGEWKAQMTKAFEKKVRYMLRQTKDDHGMTIYPYLKLFEPQVYVQCMLQEVENLASYSEGFSPHKAALWRRLSNRIYTKFITMDKIRNKVPSKMNTLYRQYLDSFMDNDLDLTTHRQLWQAIISSSPDGPSLDIPEKVWPHHVFATLGKLLYEMIIYNVKVDCDMLKTSAAHKRPVPAFYTIFRNYNNNQSFEEVKPHPVLIKLYQGAEVNDLTFETDFLPMVVPPLPWISTFHGGYLFNAVRLVRTPMQAQTQTQRVQDTVATEQLSAVLDSVNILSAAAWIVNKPVLDIIISIFNNKGNDSLDIPPPVSECPAAPAITKGMSAVEKSEVYRQREKLRQKKGEMYSLWCQELYRLSIANKFRDEIFWFPHNLDFRGRTYPCPPHFNHLGSDMTRSILKFAKGKPLGPKGLDWMKIHLVNLTGFKKRSPNRERLDYANEMLPEIFDSADKPLTGNKWWQKADEPWQALACCMEITNALRSPDPQRFVSHLPVHQDGSCNGLQHYAALGGDQSGAESVNLWPYDRPQDVYSDVCELVEREREKDAAEGLAIAKHLEGFVRRKVIKQTVMTTVYGVTRYGANFQILRQLKDIPEFPQTHAWKASIYLTDKTFSCLNEMFSSTKAIQDWLTLSAQVISSVRQRPVEWVTPVGLTVIQPYHRPVSVTRHGSTTYDNFNYFEKPNTMKQKNAFPPNFIHSLDSTHMMLTSLYCMRAGITFVSVHDCFWTHPSDVEIMNKICREQFVALHQQPILEDLSQQMIRTYAADGNSDGGLAAVRSEKLLYSVLASVPEKGDFDLEKVLESTYFFS